MADEEDVFINFFCGPLALVRDRLQTADRRTIPYGVRRDAVAAAAPKRGIIAPVDGVSLDSQKMRSGHPPQHPSQTGPLAS